jgi:hypothetical protein
MSKFIYCFFFYLYSFTLWDCAWTQNLLKSVQKSEPLTVASGSGRELYINKKMPVFNVIILARTWAWRMQCFVHDICVAVSCNVTLTWLWLTLCGKPFTIIKCFEDSCNFGVWRLGCLRMATISFINLKYVREVWGVWWYYAQIAYPRPILCFSVTILCSGTHEDVQNSFKGV